MERPRDGREAAERLALRTGATLFFLIFTYLAWRRQDAFEMGRFDLGNMSQAVWATAQGHILSISDVSGNQLSRLGIHVDPILAALAPIYWVWPDPKSLLLLQAAVVASGAFPVYRLARAELAGAATSADRNAGAWPSRAATRYLPLALAFSYLLYPPLQYAVLEEFHPVTLAAPLLLFTIWYLHERRYPAAALFALLAAATKEEVSLLLVAVGIYAVLVWRDRRAGTLLAVGGLAWFAIATQVVIPHFNSGEQSLFLDRYEEVGGSVSGILETVVTDPGKVIGVALSGSKIWYLPALLAPLIMLPIAAPFALLLASPEVAANLLSSQEAQSSYRYHYVAPIVPFIFLAGVLGARRVGRRIGRAARFAPVALILAALVSGWLMGPLPWWSKLPLGSGYKADTYYPDGHDRVAERAIELVPDGATVSATNQLGAHLSERESVLVFPHVEGADYVVVDEVNPSYGEARGTSDQAAAVVSLRRDRRYRLIFAEDGVLVFKARRTVSTSHRTKTRLRVKTDQTKSEPR